VSEWRPIETAPPDGREILAWIVKPDGSDLGVSIIQRDIDDEWIELGTNLAPYRPTHWMPLPVSPVQK
jgi:hypothetical protein